MTASHLSDIRPLLHLHNELPIKKKFTIEATIYKYIIRYNYTHTTLYKILDFFFTHLANSTN